MYLKRSHFVALMFSIMATLVATAQSSSDVLKTIVQTPQITTFFEGTFDHLGIEITDSDEQLTLHHEGNHIRIEDGLDHGQVDFVLQLNLTGIENLVKYTEDGVIDDNEATRIARVFFTPFTRVTMQNPILTENRKRKAAGIEDLIHVHLIFPDGTTAAAHTLIYASDQWIVIEDLVGTPKRVFKLQHGPALEYQRKVFSAIKTDTRKGWISFVRWYKTWRNVYSV